MNSENWSGKAFAFFSNKRCEAFPCHEVNNAEDFNCLFCYCPLYALDDKCGGYFSYLDNGTKDCSQCAMPHKKENYGLITRRLVDVCRMMQTRRKTVQSPGENTASPEGH